MIEKIKKVLENKNHKALLSNFFSLSALQVAGMILPLITLPYILRVIGFNNYGIIVLATSLIAYFQSVTDFSFKITATRDVAISRDSPRKLNIIYSKVLIIKFILLLVSFSIITSIVFLYPPFREEKLIFFLSMPLLLGYALFPEWFFQGIEKMEYISFLDIGIKVFFTICIFIFIKEKEDYWIYPLLQSAGYIGGGLVGQFLLIKKYKLKFVWLKRRIIKNTLIKNYPIFVNQFVPTLYNNTTTLLLGILGTSQMVGIYAAIKKIIDIAIRLLNIISRVFFPFLNRNYRAFGTYKKLILYSTISLSVLIIVFNQLIFWYLNIEYPQAIFILLILVIGIVGFSLYDIYGLNHFIIKRKDKIVMANTLKASIIGLVLAFPLIHFFGILGAAINLTAGRLIMGGGLYLKYLKTNLHEN